MQASTLEEATAKPKRGFAYDFVGVNEVTTKAHGFLVVREPGAVIRPHFHGVNQYQVVTKGGGTIGKKDLAPGVLQYSDKFTPYGPIIASQEGIDFFTLRELGYPSGAHYMPESKAEKTGPTGRNLIAAADRTHASETASRMLFEQEDGVEAYELSAAPGAQVPATVQRDGRGSAYIVVVAGSVKVAEMDYPESSCLFLEASEPMPEMKAGPEGAVVSYMAFPAPTARA